MAVMGRPPIFVMDLPGPRSVASDPTGHWLRVEADAVCPRCLRWIEPTDYVRRTAFGPLQHETCPAG